MALSTTVKGESVSLQVIIDGDLQGGSFARVTNFELTPRTDINELDYLGERLSILDYQHNGYDFSFEMNTQDRRLWDLLQATTQADFNDEAQPAVNIVVTITFLDPAEAPLQFLLGNCVVKVDSIGFGGRKEQVVGKVSGKCDTAEELG